MKKILLYIISLAMVGCGSLDRLKTKVTGELTYKCAKSGIEYVQSDSGLAPLYAKDGSLVSCK